MSEFYEYCPPGPEEQHQRLVALRQLTSRGIPAILWAEDALCYVYPVATALFDQQILVPDDHLEEAAAVLQEGRYVPTVPAWDYAELLSHNRGLSPFPTSIRLRHLDIPENEPYKLAPLPGFILLLPQSYFGLDVRDKHRFQSLVPPLPPSNSDILVPKYNTFLEGLVHFILNPPTGLLDNPHPHYMGKAKHDIFIGYLTSWRVFYDYNVEPPLHELFPEEEHILGELQTEDAYWYMHLLFYERRCVNFKDLKKYMRKKLGTDAGPELSVSPGGLGPNATPGLSRLTPSGGSSGLPRTYSTVATPTAALTGSVSPSRLPRLRQDEGHRVTSATKTALSLSRLLRRAR